MAFETEHYGTSLAPVGTSVARRKCLASLFDDRGQATMPPCPVIAMVRRNGTLRDISCCANAFQRLFGDKGGEQQYPLVPSRSGRQISCAHRYVSGWVQTASKVSLVIDDKQQCIVCTAYSSTELDAPEARSKQVAYGVTHREGPVLKRKSAARATTKR